MFEILENFFTVFGFICLWIILAAWIIAATRKVTQKPNPERVSTGQVMSLDDYRASVEVFDQESTR